MRLAKIKNKYLFNSKEPNGVHTYAIYYDKQKKESRCLTI